MCIIDHYPLGNQRTEISGGLNISEKLILCVNNEVLERSPHRVCSHYPHSWITLRWQWLVVSYITLGWQWLVVSNIVIVI